MGNSTKHLEHEPNSLIHGAVFTRAKRTDGMILSLTTRAILGEIVSQRHAGFLGGFGGSSRFST